MLGIKTLQFPKELYYDLDHDIIRKFDGFTDNPLPLIYRELDKRHSNSKFIHTIRDEDSWLKSVKWLFTTGAVKFNWQNHKFADEFHTALYGTTQFDETIFLKKYRAYNQQVRDYFANRPNDYLLFNIEAGDGFEKLCPFLGRPIPANTPFPRRNQSEAVLKVRGRKLYCNLKSKIMQFISTVH